jgi:hypothetical protein
MRLLLISMRLVTGEAFHLAVDKRKGFRWGLIRDKVDRVVIVAVEMTVHADS